MENAIINTDEQHTLPVKAHFDIKLEGWPAATAIMTFCVSGVILYAIYATTGKAPSFPQNA